MLATLLLTAALGLSSETPDLRVPFADPQILTDGGRYYLYGSTVDVGVEMDDGVSVAVSEDGVHWRANVGRSAQGLALHRDDTFGNFGFWAAECHKIGTKYHLLYTAERRVCIAEGPSPLGPFRQEGRAPLIDRETIDNTLFVDDDGTAYMLYASLEDAERIHIVELDSGLRRVKSETDRMILEPTDEWELRKSRLVEGPALVKHGGRYYLLYSANDYKSHDYAVGYAVADNPFGPYVKAVENPIIRRAGGLVGTGHGAPYRALDGSLRYVFHAHDSASAPHPRRTYSVGLSFKDVGGRTTLAADTRAPVSFVLDRKIDTRRPPVEADLLVVGDNEAACAAAVQAVRSGVRRVVLVADCQMLGGQYSAQGVGPVDERVYVFGANLDFPRSGMALEIINAMGDYNLKRYGKAWPGNCWSATRTIEPRPAAQIFDRLIAECGESLKVWRGYRPVSVLKDGGRIAGVRFERKLEVRASLTIDATDWGDVIRLGGVRHYSGVDPKSRFGEASAPETVGEIERQEMNPITWTMTLVEKPDARPIPKPEGYDRANYPVSVIWRDDGIFTEAYQRGVNAVPYTQRRLVDVRHFKLTNAVGDVIQLNATDMDYPLCQWPKRIAAALEKVERGASKLNFAELSDAAKQIVYADARARSLGYLYFLQNDNPSSVERMRKFELTDEFGTPDRLPPKPYIREGLRLAAVKMLTANEIAVRKGEVPVWAKCPDDAAFGFQFHLDFHPTRREYPDAGGKPDVWRPRHSGTRDWRANGNRAFFPYSGFVPETAEGLLGAGRNVGVSSLAQSALRLHPQMVLSGQCAGALAALSLAVGKSPREVVADPSLVCRLQESMVRPADGHPGVAIWARHGIEPGMPGFYEENIPVVRPYPVKYPSGFKYNPPVRK